MQYFMRYYSQTPITWNDFAMEGKILYVTLKKPSQWWKKNCIFLKENLFIYPANHNKSMKNILYSKNNLLDDSSVNQLWQEEGE